MRRRFQKKKNSISLWTGTAASQRESDSAVHSRNNELNVAYRHTALKSSIWSKSDSETTGARQRSAADEALLPTKEQLSGKKKRKKKKRCLDSKVQTLYSLVKTWNRWLLCNISTFPWNHLAGRLKDTFSCCAMTDKLSHHSSPCFGVCFVIFYSCTLNFQHWLTSLLCFFFP